MNIVVFETGLGDNVCSILMNMRKWYLPYVRPTAYKCMQKHCVLVHQAEIPVRNSFPRLRISYPLKNLQCEMFMRRRSKILVGHYPREDFFVPFHAVDEQLIQHPFQIG